MDERQYPSLTREGRSLYKFVDPRTGISTCVQQTRLLRGGDGAQLDAHPKCSRLGIFMTTSELRKKN